MTVWLDLHGSNPFRRASFCTSSDTVSRLLLNRPRLLTAAPCTLLGRCYTKTLSLHA
jgi:hypothetical protein